MHYVGWARRTSSRQQLLGRLCWTRLMTLKATDSPLWYLQVVCTLLTCIHGVRPCAAALQEAR